MTTHRDAPYWVHSDPETPTTGAGPAGPGCVVVSCEPRPTNGDLLVCRGHHEGTLRMLGLLPDLDEELRIALKAYRSPQAPKPETSPGSFETPDAISSRVTAMRHNLHMRLSNHVGPISIERDFHHPPNNVPAYVDFLLINADWIHHHPHRAPWFYDDIALLVKKATSLASESRAAGNYLGPCPMTIAQDGVSVDCGAPIRFDAHRHAEDDTYEPECPRCKTVMTMPEWVRRMTVKIGALPTQQLTAAPLAMWLNAGLRRSDITASMIRGWKHKGITVQVRRQTTVESEVIFLHEVGRNGKGQPLYDRDEAEAFARKKWHLPALEESA